MALRARFFSVLFLLISLGSLAQDLNGPIPMNPKVRTGKLSNGLVYYIVQNKKPENKAELRIVVNAGSVLEDEDQLGLAHFMEHMNFNGLKNFPHNDIVHYLQSVGVKFGADLNAYTSFEETVYMLPIPTNDKSVVDKGFTIISDWSRNALLDPEEIEKERGVVLEESRLGKGADDRMMQKYLPEMLNGSIYANRLPIGQDSILKNFKPSSLKRYHTDWYRPNNEAVVVIGDIDPDEAERLIKEKFGDFVNPSPERPRTEVANLPTRKQSRAMVVTDKEASNISIQILGNSKPSKKMVTGNDYRNSLIKNLMSNLLITRLDELKSKSNPPFVYGYAYSGEGWVRGYDMFMGGASCGEDKIKDAIQALVRECLRAQKYGFTKDELDRYKSVFISQYEQQYNERDKTESAQLVGEYIQHFLVQQPAPGIEWEFDFVKKVIPTIKIEEINALTKDIELNSNYFLLLTSPENPKLPSESQLTSWMDEVLKESITPYSENKLPTALLKTTPVAGSITKEEKNEKLGTTTYTLSNGAIVTIKPTTFKNDQIVLQSYRNGGSSVYTKKDYQSANFSNNVVEEMGYGDFSQTDLTKFLSGKKVDVNMVVDDYQEYISGSSNVKDLETFFQLLYLKATSPRKDLAAFESFKSREKQMLESIMASPEASFAEGAYVELYQHHPRAHLIPKAEEYEKINIDNAIAFYQKRLGNMNGMHFYFAGNIKEDEFKKLLTLYVASLPGGPIDTKYKDLKMRPKPGVNNYTLNKGKEAKSMLNHYIFSEEKFDAQTSFLLNILNEIVNNKIIDTIRESMSAIYGGGIRGSMQKIPYDLCILTSNLPCAPENVKPVDSAFWVILESVKKPGGITEADLQRARKPMLEKYKVSIKDNSFWLGNLKNADRNGYDPERILTYEARLSAVTPDQLIEVAKRVYSKKNVFTATMMPQK